MDFLLREWLFISSALGLIFTSFYLGSFPSYEFKDIIPIFLLFVFFIVVKGIENSYFLLRVAYLLEKGKWLSFKLVLITFFLSMFVTIDVSLITMLPVVLSLKVENKENLAILVALTAHVGAALTPFGTPQNLFIYSYYNVNTYDFITSISPFSFGMLLFFSIISLFMDKKNSSVKNKKKDIDKNKAIIYIFLLIIMILSLLRVLPQSVSLFVFAFVLIFDKKSLRVDYPLLLTFVIFVGLTFNIKEMISGSIHQSGHIFLLSSLISQFISNVPTALLFEKFTSNWEALLWGTNVGGFGSLIAALANLITYKLYISYGDQNRAGIFTFKFLFAGYISFFIATVIYFIVFYQ